MISQNPTASKIAHYPGFPQFPPNIGQGGNQFINTTTPPSMVTQVGYSTATRIEID